MLAIDFDAVRGSVPLMAFLESLGCGFLAEGDAHRLACPLHNERHGRSMISTRTAGGFVTANARLTSRVEVMLSTWPARSGMLPTIVLWLSGS